MERYVAIDNVCAWPNLTRLPDSSIVANIFNQPCHGNWEGDVECWGSEDGGRLWTKRGTPAVHEPTTNRMNVAAGLAANGDLIVFAAGWSHRPPLGGPPAGHGPPATVLLPWVCRSRDGGRTWTRGESPQPPSSNSPYIMPFGDITRLANGHLGVCVYSWEPPKEHNSYFYTSADDGHSWQYLATIQRGEINETTPVLLPNGEVLACARTLGDQHLDLFRSRDHGRSWTREQAVSEGKQHPANFLLLPDGRLLLTYGDRRPDNRGIVVRVSADNGHTWGPPKQIVTLETGDLGYPATVQNLAGQLVTAWYCQKVAAHQRYHMGTLIWDLSDLPAST